MNRLPRLVSVLVLLSLVAGGCAAKSSLDVQGVYRFEDGSVLSVRASVDDTLRSRAFESGESRRLHPAGPARYVAGPGFSGKKPVELTVEFEPDADGRSSRLSWTPANGAARIARRVVREEWLSFESDGVSLAGRLSLPDTPGPCPAIVLVHGSGSDAATDFYFNGDFFAAHGIAALTYDKRGTGRSDGSYTFDFDQLARDAAAAVGRLKTHTEIDATRIGLAGYSQGSWVAPLAATLTDDVAFVIVNYGLIGSPADEARVETRNVLAARGVSGRALDQLDELTDAAVRVVAADFEDGWDEFERLKKKYKREPWFDKLSGTVVGKMVRYPRWVVRWLGRKSAPVGMPWYHDGVAVLEQLDVPSVWLIAEKDDSAPPELTLPHLEQLQRAGKPVRWIIFPGADHTMLTFETHEGKRTYTGYAPTYFAEETATARALTSLPPTPDPGWE
ncbi:MAG: alpha/beta hydrolase [bacterium]|nr:alpha/beta hydrolase [bacterium]